MLDGLRRSLASPDATFGFGLQPSGFRTQANLVPDDAPLRHSR
jgi:hypothetical protein